MEEARRTYLPAAGYHWSLPLYDPIVRLLGADRARQALLDQAAIRSGHRVLDVGCGTGSLVVRIKRAQPNVEVVGVDPDPKALARARRKAKRAAVGVELDRGFSDQLPYADLSFDRVLSSFMFHHLPEDEKEDSLREVRRVLKPGGSFHLLDFGGGESGARGSLVRWLHSSDRMKDNSESRVLALMQGAGFSDPKKVANRTLLVLPIAYYRATTPASRASDA